MYFANTQIKKILKFNGGFEPPPPLGTPLAIVSIQLNIVTCPIRIRRNSYETMLLHRVLPLFVVTVLSKYRRRNWKSSTISKMKTEHEVYRVAQKK